ncbi:MAG: MFS transporter [Chloroflexota bacterium]|nr:MFS transporter [Chloroflexota bacterium]MDE2961785.1 MFS transporter [Chloroflexota bacterium]
MAVATVPLLHALPVWAAVFSQNFGWAPPQMSWAFTLPRPLGWALGPIAGLLVDKIGPRKMIIIGMMTLAAGWFLFSRVGSLWMFYTSIVVVSVGAGLGSWVPVTAVLKNWFRRRLCTASSIPALGLSLGGFLIVPLMAWATVWNAESGAVMPGRLGWQNTALLVGAAGLAMSVIAALLIRDRPGDGGQQRDGIRSDDEEPLPEYGFREAVKARAFWLLVLGAACFQASASIADERVSMLLLDYGYALEVGARYQLVHSVASLAFIPVGGWFGDRMPIRHALLLFTSFQLAGSAVFLVAHNAPLFYIVAMMTGAGAGGHQILVLAVIAIYFGTGRFASILGVAGALSASVSGILTFLSALGGSPVLAVAAAVILAVVGAAAYRCLGQPQPAPSQRELTGSAPSAD